MDRLILNGVEVAASVAVVLAAGVALLAVEEVFVSWRESGKRPVWSGPQVWMRSWWRMFVSLFEERPSAGTGLVLVAVVALFGVIPWVGWASVEPDGGGLLVLLAMWGLAVWGLLVQRDDVKGIDRAARWAQTQLSLLVSVMGVVLLSGSVGLEAIVAAQARAGVWWMVVQPLGLGVFVLAGLESVRVVGDEERRGLAALASQLQLVALAYLCVDLFGGGWGRTLTDPGLGDVIVSALVLQGKVVAVLAGLMVLRRVSWRGWGADVLRNGTFLVAVGFANLLLTVVLLRGPGSEGWVVSAVVMWSGLAMLVSAGYVVSRCDGRRTHVLDERKTGE